MWLENSIPDDDRDALDFDSDPGWSGSSSSCDSGGQGGNLQGCGSCNSDQPTTPSGDSYGGSPACCTDTPQGSLGPSFGCNCTDDGSCGSPLGLPSANLDCGTITVNLPDDSYQFQSIDGNYQLLSPSDPTAALTADGGVSFSAQGSTWSFAGFDSSIPADQQGTFAGVTTPDGQSFTVGDAIAGDTRLAARQQPYRPHVVAGNRERYVFAYSDGGTPSITSLSYQSRGDQSDWSDQHNVSRQRFDYYDSDGDYGYTGDLRTVYTENWNAAQSTWEVKKATHLGYDPGPGRRRFVLDRRQFAALLDQFPGAADLNDIGAAHESAIIAAAGKSYLAYDSAGRMATVKLDGGRQTYQYAYQENLSPQYYDGFNSWQLRTTETLFDPRGNLVQTKVVYLNYLGKLILSNVSTPDGKCWLEFHQYDNNGLEILVAQPSALAGYAEGENLIAPAYRADSGLVKLTEYYPATDPNVSETQAGAVAGYVQYEKIRRGNNPDSVVTMKHYAYKMRTDGNGNTIYPVGQVIAYGESGGVVTGYDYAWQPGAIQMASRITYLPVVPVSQNGPSDVQGAAREEYFDASQNLIWAKDELGRVTYYAYDPKTVAVVQTIQDYNVQNLPAGVTLPAGLTIPDDGLHLITDTTVDNLGRATQVLGPQHEAVDKSNTAITVRTAQWTLYDDAGNRVVESQGYVQWSPLPPGEGQGEGGVQTVLVNPISITLSDAYGRIANTVQAVAADTTRPPQLSDTFTNQLAWRSWTHSEYDPSTGRLAAVCMYHNIPASGTGTNGAGANYICTKYGYNWQERQNCVTAPGGTITRTTFDAAGHPIASYVGTDDTGATDDDPTGGGAEGNNMRLVSSQEYDDGQGGGDGNLTRTTQYVDGTGTLDRVTRSLYDWRNRLIVTLGEEGSCQTRQYDNFGRVVRAQQRDGSPDGLLLGQTDTFYDNLGRVYQTQQYAVDSSGEVGNALASYTWYDAAGHPIKQQSPGSQAFTKTAYDGLGRPIQTYMGYDPSGETTYAGAASIFDDLIFEQTEADYDPLGNVLMTTTRQRNHDATGTGGLTTPPGTGPQARVSKAGFWYDGPGRQIATANYGTGTLDRSSQTTVPAPSDTVLVTATGYNDAGQPCQTVDPAGRIDQTSFDNLGRVIQTVQNYVPGGTGSDQNITLQQTYTADGQIGALTAINPETGNQVTRYVYGTTAGGIEPEIYRNDLLRAVIYPDSDDATSPLGNGPDGLYDRVEYLYNRLGEQVQLKDQNGTVHEFLFDKLGRPISDRVTNVGAGIDTAVLRIDRGYNRRGLLERVTSYADSEGIATINEVLYRYNDFGQLAGEYQEHAGGVDANTLSVAYGYDESSSNGLFTNALRATSLTYPTGRQIMFSYGPVGSSADFLNRLDAIQDESGNVLSRYTYLGRGTIVMENYPQPGVTLDYFGGMSGVYAGFDNFGRVVQQAWKTVGGTLDQFNYGYDRAGNRLWRQNAVSASQNPPVRLDECYAYDGAGRLVSSQRGTLALGATSIVGTPVREEDWTLDATGNWPGYVQKTAGVTVLDQTRAHNQANELLTASSWADFAYDRCGNMTSLPKPADPTIALTCAWDAWNRLVATDDGTTTVTYAYDGLGRRITKSMVSVGATDYYLADQQVLETRYTPSGGAAALQYQYVWSPRYIDAPVLRDDATAGAANPRLYFLGDGNFNVTCLVGPTGVAAERYVYDPYGTVAVFDGSWTVRTSVPLTSPLYTGREYDPETGLSYYRARYYSPKPGRFLCPDPTGFGRLVRAPHFGSGRNADGLELRGARQDHSGNVNLFQYANGSPIVYADPTGRLSFHCGVRLSVGPMSNSWGFRFEIPISIPTSGCVSATVGKSGCTPLLVLGTVPLVSGGCDGIGDDVFLSNASAIDQYLTVNCGIEEDKCPPGCVCDYGAASALPLGGKLIPIPVVAPALAPTCLGIIAMWCNFEATYSAGKCKKLEGPPDPFAPRR